MTASDNPYAQGGYGNYSTSFGSAPATPPTQTVSFGAPAAPATAPAPVKDVTTQSFRADVIDASRDVPVLVDFWAPWCGPCKTLQPLIEKAVADSGGRVRLAKMNIDEHPAIAGQLGIQSIPAVIAFKNGQPVDGFMGAIPDKDIRKFIDKVAGPQADPAAEIMAMAEEAKAAGDLERMAQIYMMALQQGLATPAIIAGLGEALLDLGDLAGVDELLAQVPDETKADKAFTALNAKLKLAREVAELGDPVALSARIASDPRDFEARFDLSAIHNARGERDAAADLLLDIMQKDRAWRDDGARLRLLEYFEAWGMTDPATLSGRRKLSSILFR
jgi:putative thioredoxin